MITIWLLLSYGVIAPAYQACTILNSTDPTARFSNKTIPFKPENKQTIQIKNQKHQQISTWNSTTLSIETIEDQTTTTLKMNIEIHRTPVIPIAGTTAIIK